LQRDQTRFTIESASSSSSRLDDLEPDLIGAGRENADLCSESEVESLFSQDLDNWTDSFVVLMSDSFEVISLPAEMMQVVHHVILRLLSIVHTCRRNFLDFIYLVIHVIIKTVS